jgi:signal transduction histidine kinase
MEPILPPSITHHSYIHEILEEDRARIAREIHDVLGQQLTCLKMDLSNMVANPLRELEFIEKVNESIRLVDTIIDTTRKISMDLRPAILDDLGLLAALEWQCREFELQTRIPCSFKTEVDGDSFERRFSNGVFRVLQEALTNIRRHARATIVTVLIRREKDFFTLEVNDNGQGVHPLDAKKTLGILGMTERAQLLGGTFHLHSEEKLGTTVEVVLPIIQQNHEDTDSR